MNSIPWNYDFARIVGPRSSGAANFEELVAQLLAAQMGAESIDGSGGDLGIDCYVGRFRGRLTAFQVKYFLGRLRKSQRSQIKHSLAVALRHHKVDTWILCTPNDPTPAERGWLNDLATATEWWGETKLRSLLAQYPNIAGQFFSEPVLSSRLAAVEEEVGRLRDELIPRLDAHSSTVRVRSYIANAEKDCVAALADILALRSGNESPWIAIDFSELYGYLSADPSLSVHRPLVDFCLAYSPSPTILPPGTVYEMGMFVRRCPFRFEADDFLDRLRQTPEARLFVQEFTADPSSSASMTAYRSFVARMRDCGMNENSEISRLSASLRSEKLRPAPAEYRDVRADEFDQALRYFEYRRPAKHGPNRADAANIEFLLASEKHFSVRSRMISSARNMIYAAEEFCAGRALVRTPRQFALSLTGSDGSEGINRLTEAVADIRRLRNASVMDVSLETNPGTAIPTLLVEFARTYRDVLRPIDDMIEDGLRVISRLPVPRAYYLLLRGDAEEVAVFRKFWHRVTEDHHVIDEILCDEHGYEDIADQMESDDVSGGA